MYVYVCMCVCVYVCTVRCSTDKSVYTFRSLTTATWRINLKNWSMPTLLEKLSAQNHLFYTILIIVLNLVHTTFNNCTTHIKMVPGCPKAGTVCLPRIMLFCRGTIDKSLTHQIGYVCNSEFGAFGCGGAGRRWNFALQQAGCVYITNHTPRVNTHREHKYLATWRKNEYYNDVIQSGNIWTHLSLSTFKVCL